MKFAAAFIVFESPIVLWRSQKMTIYLFFNLAYRRKNRPILALDGKLKIACERQQQVYQGRDIYRGVLAACQSR
jgi:hypothetical protein